MAVNWPIVDALLGGTSAMRKAAKAWLPKWPAEADDAYAVRLSVATLFPALRRTLSVMSGKPFSRALTYGEDMPEEVREWCDDVDLLGRNLHTFASEMLYEALAYGLCGILVEFPVNSGARTLGEEKAAGLRPYMVQIKHGDILGWRVERRGGAMKLTQLRLWEVETVDDGDFGAKTVNRVRVLTPGAWQLYELNDKGEAALIDEGITTLKAVPFVPVYGMRKGYMLGESPMLDLAYLNVKHWQSQSDQDNILRVARVPILAFNGDDDDGDLKVGASYAVKLPKDASMFYVEHSGAAIGAGAESLLKLEEQMIQTGAELLVAKPGQRTATEASNDAEANKSDLMRITEGFEDAINMALQFMGNWVGMPHGGSVSLFKDYGSLTLSDASAQLILSMQQGGLITRGTALREQQRRGLLNAELDPELELAAVEAEGPKLGEMNSGGESVDYDDEEQYGGYTATHTSLGIKVSR